MGTARSVGVVAMVLAAGLALPAMATVTYSTVALSAAGGSIGPGVGAGVTFADLGGQQPSINDLGQVLFRGTTSAAGNPTGLWLFNGSSNVNQQIVGGPRPGGGVFAATDSFNSFVLNSSGQMAYRLGAGTGIFGDTGSGFTRAALTGDLAPGAGGAAYGAITSGTPLMNSSGQVAYLSALAVNATSTPPVVLTSGINNASGIWIGTPGSTSLVLRQNDPVLSLASDGSVRVGAFAALTPSFNGNGRYVVAGALQGSVTTGTGAAGNSTVILSNRNGSLEVIARAGDAAPTASGVLSTTEVYRTMTASRIAFNDAGNVAFANTLRTTAGVSTSTALFTDVGGTMRQIARSGDVLPPIAGAIGSEFAGVTYSILFGAPQINGSGLMAFTAGLANTGPVPVGAASNTTVLLTRDAATGVLTRIVRAGDVAVVNGSPVAGDAFFTQINDIALNAGGQMLFASTLNGNSVSVGAGNGSALFGYDPVQGLQLVARTGDLFEVAPGDLRTISSIGGLVASGGQDGRASSLNNNGVATFALGFVGGTSGVFTAVIPAPGAAAVMSLGLLVAGRRRR